jgi:Transposase, Mutator family
VLVKTRCQLLLATVPGHLSGRPLERLNNELKRRRPVVGVFPDETEVVGLAGAVLVDSHDEPQAAWRPFFPRAPWPNWPPRARMGLGRSPFGRYFGSRSWPVLDPGDGARCQEPHGPRPATVVPGTRAPMSRYEPGVAPTTWGTFDSRAGASYDGRKQGFVRELGGMAERLSLF